MNVITNCAPGKISTCIVCMIASALAGSVLILGLWKPGDIMDKYKATLSLSQLSTLEKIQQERLQIALSGLAIGTLASLPFSYNWCYSALVLFGVQHTVYTLTPKSDWMLLHHNTSAQDSAWVDLYKEMVWRSHVSSLLGALLYVGVFLVKGI